MRFLIMPLFSSVCVCVCLCVAGGSTWRLCSTIRTVYWWRLRTRSPSWRWTTPTAAPSCRTSCGSPRCSVLLGFQNKSLTLNSGDFKPIRGVWCKNPEERWKLNIVELKLRRIQCVSTQRSTGGVRLIRGSQWVLAWLSGAEPVLVECAYLGRVAWHNVDCRTRTVTEEEDEVEAGFPR